MITVEIKITTEAGDPVVNINQRCKENRLEEVLKAALHSYNATDDNEPSMKIVLKTDDIVESVKRANRENQRYK